MRKYQELWKRIAANEQVTVQCHRNAVATVKKAIEKEKYQVNRARKYVDLPRFGRTVTKVEQMAERKDFVRITFSINYSGDNL